MKKLKVWIVSHEWDYEGAQVVSVHSSLVKARAWAREHAKQLGFRKESPNVWQGTCEGLIVESYEVD